MKIALHNISFSYSDAPLLDNISFHVDRGEILGLLGPNGAGKSTLLKIINRQLQPQSGEILLNDKPISNMTVRQIANNIATVPQSPKTAFGFSVREIVSMGRRPHHSMMSALDKRDIRIINQALEDCELLHLADRPITELSGGESQLTFVARALAQESDILLLDEATSNLDISHTFAILSIIKKKAANGLAVISVIHDLNTAISFCNKIAFISDGNIIGPGLPDELITKDNISNIYKVRPDHIKIHQIPFFVETRLL